MILLSILGRTLFLLFGAVQLLMLVRAVMSWFPPSDGEGGPIRMFVYSLTELFIMPVRAVIDRFEWARRSPIDISFLVTMILLSLLSSLFSAV